MITLLRVLEIRFNFFRFLPLDAVPNAAKERNRRVLREVFEIRFLFIKHHLILMLCLCLLRLDGLLDLVFKFHLLRRETKVMPFRLAVTTAFIIIRELTIKEKVFNGLLIGTLEIESLKETLQDLPLRESI